MNKINFDDDFIYKTGERIIPGAVSVASLSEHYTRYYFVKDLCRGKRVLNVACGAGYGSEVLIGSAKEVYNIDISEKLVAYGNLKYGNYKNHFLTMDAQKMSFPDGYFDIIVSFETFEHLPKYKSFLSECHRVLGKDGQMVVSMPNKNITSPNLKKPLNPFHFKEWTVAEFKKAIAGIYDLRSLYGQNFTPPNNYSKLFSSKISRFLRNFIYTHTPAVIFKIIKIHFLKFKEIPAKEIRLFDKDKIVRAKDVDFQLNKKGLGYAIMIVLLKKVTK